MTAIGAAGGSALYLRHRHAAPAPLPVAVEAAPAAAPAPVVEPTQPAAVVRQPHAGRAPKVVSDAPETAAATCAAPVAGSAVQCAEASPAAVEETAPEAPAEEPAPRKRNVVVRSLGKVFGKFKHKP